MARLCSLGAVLLLTAAVGAAGYGRLRQSQNGRLFKGVHFVYEGKTARENLVHRRFWLPDLSQRLCRCHEGQCPYQWSDAADEHSIQINNRMMMKFCESVRPLRQCGPQPAVAAVLERHTEVGPLQLDHERRDVKVNCSCPYPSLHEKISPTVSHGNTQITAYTCRELERCRPGETCGHIRIDTYSTYHTCLCPTDHFCLFREQSRVKMKRDVEQLFYDSTAYIGECRRLHR